MNLGVLMLKDTQLGSVSDLSVMLQAAAAFCRLPNQQRLYKHSQKTTTLSVSHRTEGVTRNSLELTPAGLAASGKDALVLTPGTVQYL